MRHAAIASSAIAFGLGIISAWQLHDGAQAVAWLTASLWAASYWSREVRYGR